MAGYWIDRSSSSSSNAAYVYTCTRDTCKGGSSSLTSPLQTDDDAGDDDDGRRRSRRRSRYRGRRLLTNEDDYSSSSSSPSLLSLSSLSSYSKSTTKTTMASLFSHQHQRHLKHENGKLEICYEVDTEYTPDADAAAAGFLLDDKWNDIFHNQDEEFERRSMSGGKKRRMLNAKLPYFLEHDYNSEEGEFLFDNDIAYEEEEEGEDMYGGFSLARRYLIETNPMECWSAFNYSSDRCNSDELQCARGSGGPM
jgi:hypothetical protein